MAYSIAEIARRAGVSTTTVSRVVNGIPRGVGPDTRAHVQAVIDEMNYRPNLQARGIAMSRSGVVGVIIPDVSNLFYPQILRGIDDSIAPRGLSMLLCNSGGDPERERELLLSMVDRRAEGVILCSGVSNEAFLREYRAYRMPLVMIGRSFDSAYADGCISGDNETGMYASASFLLRHGHRKILYLDGPAGVAGPMYRLIGYRRALAEAGLPAAPELICQGDFSVEYGRDTVLRLLDAGVPFTAVAAGSDLIAIGAVKALRERGRNVPADAEVIGFDDIDLSRIFEPCLSTVSKPHYDMAAQAAGMLMQIIAGQKPPASQIRAPARLILRETTRPENTKGDAPR